MTINTIKLQQRKVSPKTRYIFRGKHAPPPTPPVIMLLFADIFLTATPTRPSTKRQQCRLSLDNNIRFNFGALLTNTRNTLLPPTLCATSIYLLYRDVALNSLTRPNPICNSLLLRRTMYGTTGSDRLAPCPPPTLHHMYPSTLQ